METIAMRVPDENIASVRNVDTVRKVGYTFATNSSQEMTFVAKNHHIVTLKVANIKFLAVYGNIRRLPHKVAAIKPTDQLATFADDEYCRTDAINCHDLPVSRNCESRDNVDVSYGDLLQKMSILREDLHARTFVAAITDHVFTGCAHHGNFSRIPQLPFVFARRPELEFEGPGFVKNLKKIRSKSIPLDKFDQMITCMRWLLVSATIMSSSRPRQNP
jgi:hypothetical protein